MTTQTATINPIRQIEAIYHRLEKAREIVAQGKVHPVIGMDGHYVVQGSQGYYLVNGQCSCPDAQQRADMHHGWCKHKLSVEILKEQPQEATTDKPKARKKARGQEGEGADNGASPKDEQDPTLGGLYPA